MQYSKMAKPKEFCFADYDIIGFDLDCTLLRYNVDEMVPLVYNLLKKFLVEDKNYPQELLDKEMNVDFFQRGLVLDTENGNILKLGRDATILRASHGTTLLSRKEIVDIYGSSRKWSVATQFFEDPLSTWNGPLSEKIRALLDYFDVAVSLVFAQAVDLEDNLISCKRQSRQPYDIWTDVFAGITQMYLRDNFSNDRSEFFKALQKDPQRYLLKCSDDVLELLKRLNTQNKATYLLTGSNIDFANFTASYALGEDWQNYFDCVICYAKKPGFFTAERPYIQIKNLSEIADSNINLDDKLLLNVAYSQGNWKQLRDTLAHKLGKHPNEVRSLYVGDNLIQDVYTPVKHHDLEAVAVCEELCTEDSYNCAYDFKKMVGSSFWGSYFIIDNEPTLWAGVIEKYAQLCVPAVQSLTQIDITQKLVTKTGYYPNTPSG